MRYAFMMIKTHAVRERNVGAILRDVERAGFTIRRMQFLDTTGWAGRSCMEQLYIEHKDQSYYDRLLESVCGPVVPVLLEHPTDGGVGSLRALAGATDPKRADPHTLRSRYGTLMPHNAVHTSDSVVSMVREAAIFWPRSQTIADLADQLRGR